MNEQELNTEISRERVLVVEDESRILSHLVQMMGEQGYAVTASDSYGDLQTRLKSINPEFDVIILDRLLRGRDSAALVEQIKEVSPDTKVLIVSAINTSAEKAALLDLGADDYITKPFDDDELVARVRALLRRGRPEIKVGNLILDSDRRILKINESEIPLQNKEFVLLKTLMRAPRRIFNKAFLYEHVWEMSADVESNVIETTVNKLRRRLEDAGANVAIKSMRHKGYWLEV